MTRIALAGVLILAAGLRAWPLVAGQLVWHPDEIFMVIYPLNMLSGDLNPHVFTYPGFHFYVLASIYALQCLAGLILDGASLASWVAQHYLWNPEALRDTARWVSVGYSTATVGMAAMIARRLCPGNPTLTGIIAALLLAINVVHIRQAPLAGTDAAQAFWFAVATWAALRLLDHSRTRDYIAAGLAVGVCAATKYPGAAVGVAVVAAHLISRRSLRDQRIWIAGAAAIGIFLGLSPYTLLDVSTFTQQFNFQVEHAAAGRWGERPGPFFHLTEGLLYGSGWVGWVLWGLGSVWMLWKRRPAHVVLVVAMVAGYVAVSWGNLVFARYVLPLLALQSAIVAHAIIGLSGYVSRSLSMPQPRLILSACLLLVIAQPLHGALTISHLLAQPDTRTEVRDWVEANVPSGAACCNFGGWAGDVQLRTQHQLWWRLKRYLDAFGRPGLAAAVADASRDTEVVHFVTYEVPEDSPLARGQLKLAVERECSLVMLHRHPLPYSDVDEVFAGELAAQATRVFSSGPGSLEGSTFDRMDVYYVPLQGFGLTRPGPDIEVWQIDPPPTPSTKASPAKQGTKGQALSGALSVEGSSLHEDGQSAAARDCLKLALQLDPDNDHAYRVLARIETAEGRVAAAVAAYQHAAEAGDRTSMRGLAKLLAALGDHEAAVGWYDTVRLGAPRDGVNLNNLAISLWALGRESEAVLRFEEAIELQPHEHWRWFNPGWSYFRNGDMTRALPYLDRAAELAPDTLRYLDIAAHAHSVVGNHEKAVELWTARLERGPATGELHVNLAHAYQHRMGDSRQALLHWRQARELLPDNPDVVLGAASLLQELGRGAEAFDWLQSFLQGHPADDRSPEIREAVARLKADTSGIPQDEF